MATTYRFNGDLVNNHAAICKNLGHLVQHIPYVGLTLIGLSVVLDIVRVIVSADFDNAHETWLDIIKEI